MDLPWRKGRRDRPPLMAPILTGAEEKSARGHRPQDALRGGAAPVILRVVYQRMADRLGPLQEDVLAAEEALDNHILAERLVGESRQRIAAPCPRHEQPGQMSATYRRSTPRKAKRLHTGTTLLATSQAPKRHAFS